MTEAEWIATADPDATLTACLQCGTVRKARLLAVACFCRLASFLRSDTRAVWDELLRTMEERADKPLPDNWSDAILEDYEHVRTYEEIDGCRELVDCYMMITCTGLAGGLMTAKNAAADIGAQGEADKQAELVRCIFGNPFRPVKFDPAWRTSDAVALARGIYDDRAFDRMPILADALQDAGCNSDDILNHCRDTNTPHARGCWVVDLVLGKE